MSATTLAGDAALAQPRDYFTAVCFDPTEARRREPWLSYL